MQVDNLDLLEEGKTLSGFVMSKYHSGPDQDAILQETNRFFADKLVVQDVAGKWNPLPFSGAALQATCCLNLGAITE